MFEVNLMSKRSIRLKELGVKVNRVLTPSEDYLLKSPLPNKNEIYRIETNEEGNQFGVIGNKSSKKIYILGDSQTECSFVRHSMRMQSILEKNLLVNGYDYEVENLGVSGSQSINVVNLLINKLSNKQGSTVIVMLPSNDVGPLRYADGYFSNHKFYASVIPAVADKVKHNNDLDFELYKRTLGLINVICKQLDLKLVFSTVCYTGEHKDLYKMNNEIRQYCSNNNIKLLDLYDQMKHNDGYFYDLLHFLPEGSEFYTEKLFYFIKDQLIRSKDKRLIVSDFAADGSHLSKMVWSDVVKVGKANSVKLIVDFEHLGDSSKPALYSVDYFCEPTESKLSKSANKEIGYYQYIEGVKGKRIENIYEIYIPENCSQIKIGLRSWGNDGIILHNAQLQVLEG